MAVLTIRNIGPLKEVRNIVLNRVNVFMGLQSSGKSTIAKIISFCVWLEKDVATRQSLARYQADRQRFKEEIEAFHKMKGYFGPTSFLEYKSDVIDLKWENGECSIDWVDRYAYSRSKVTYIPSERNMVILPEARRAEFGYTNIRSFLFDWFEARKHFSGGEGLPVLNLGISYYYSEGTEEDRIKGYSIDHDYDILLTNASSGLQSVTPLIAMVEYMTKGIYSDTSTSFDLDQREQSVKSLLAEEIALKPYYGKEQCSQEDAREFYSRLRENDGRAMELYNKYKAVADRLFKTRNAQFIIEEPEQNLFPETQRDLVYYLLQNCCNKEGNRLTLTTHSPYVLYALNNCMMAGLVSEKMSPEDLSLLKCRNSRINPADISVYEIRNGIVGAPIQDAGNGLISGNYFDEKMKELMDDFYLMLNYFESEDDSE